MAKSSKNKNVLVSSLSKTMKRISTPIGRAAKKITNPITHAQDLEQERLRFDKLRSQITKSVNDIQKMASELYEKRKLSVKLLQEFNSTVSEIKNCPVSVTKSCDRALEYCSKIADASKLEDQGLSSGADSLSKNSKTAGVIGAAGALAGSLTTAFGPSTLMALATTFGTASTGTAIASLSGAAAANAALAWLGGGAVAIGGAGVAGGTFILSLMGPIGLGIAGVAVLGSSILSRSNNNKMLGEIKRLSSDMSSTLRKLDKTSKYLRELIYKTDSVYNSLHLELLSAHGADYLDPTFPKEHLFQMASTAKLLGKLSREEVIPDEQ